MTTPVHAAALWALAAAVVAAASPAAADFGDTHFGPGFCHIQTELPANLADKAREHVVMV